MPWDRLRKNQDRQKANYNTYIHPTWRAGRWSSGLQMTSVVLQSALLATSLLSIHS